MSRLDAPVAVEGPDIELRMREVDGGMTAAFVRVSKGAGLRPALRGRGEGCHGVSGQADEILRAGAALAMAGGGGSAD